MEAGDDLYRQLRAELWAYRNALEFVLAMMMRDMALEQRATVIASLVDATKKSDHLPRTLSDEGAEARSDIFVRMQEEFEALIADAARRLDQAEGRRTAQPPEQ